MNAYAPIVRAFVVLILMEDKAVHPSNAYSPMLAIVPLKLTVGNELQPWKAYAATLLTVNPNVVKFDKPLNAERPMSPRERGVGSSTRGNTDVSIVVIVPNFVVSENIL